MDKQKLNLLKNLKQETYVRIGCSKIHGVGVFAIKDIPKGTNPFKIAGNTTGSFQPIKITKTEYEDLDQGVKKLIGDFIYREEDGSFYVPKFGMNSMDISFYMNHSTNNNVAIVDTGEDFMTTITNRKIKKGEELTINYEDFER